MDHNSCRLIPCTLTDGSVLHSPRPFLAIVRKPEYVIRLLPRKLVFPSLLTITSLPICQVLIRNTALSNSNAQPEPRFLGLWRQRMVNDVPGTNCPSGRSMKNFHSYHTTRKVLILLPRSCRTNQVGQAVGAVESSPCCQANCTPTLTKSLAAPPA
jgi:hypothetical protein